MNGSARRPLTGEPYYEEHEGNEEQPTIFFMVFMSFMV